MHTAVWATVSALRSKSSNGKGAGSVGIIQSAMLRGTYTSPAALCEERVHLEKVLPNAKKETADLPK